MSEAALRVLLIGSGGREHALAWKLAQSPRLGTLFAAPGNPGIARVAELVSLPIDQPAEVARWARAEGIHLVVVGPEEPLMGGVADALAEVGVPVFGPNRAAAEIEGSKVWAKSLMRRHGIPHAKGEVFTDVAAALAWLRANPEDPVVVKADGLALGKGVVVPENTEEAEAAIVDMLEARRFGRAGERVILEERLTGPEVSAFALVAGETALPLGLACDYKRIGDGDTGPNTGGMGGFSPPPFVDATLAAAIHDTVLARAARAMVAEGRPYLGFLYAGMMLTPDGPKTLEFNARFGDPEAQVLMPRLQSDLLELLLAATRGELQAQRISWRPEATVGVVLASGGYPGDYRQGFPIEGIEAAEAVPGALVFQAGTAGRDGALVTAGGRVLCVVGRGPDLRAARATAYRAAELIRFEDAYYRRDIAQLAEE